jgi:hypothetical protein
MEWINCSESLPEAQQQVLVNDLNGEGVLIAWWALWFGAGGHPDRRMEVGFSDCRH